MFCAILGCVRLCDPMDSSPPYSSVPGDSPGWNTGGLPCPPPGDLPKSGIKRRSPALQADSLPSMLPGRPKNTGGGSLSLLPGNFPTQESNQGLLHCRWILYQPSYLGNPTQLMGVIIITYMLRKMAVDSLCSDL